MALTLKEIREAKNDYTSLASQTIRQLAFGGIAVVWLFRNQKDMADPFDERLLVALLMFTLAIAFDVLQYLWSAWLWTVQQWKVDRLGRPETFPVPDLPPVLLAPGYVLFALKQIFAIAGAALVVWELAHRWRLLA